LGNSRKIHRLDSYDYYIIGYFYYRITIIIVFDYTDIQKNTLQGEKNLAGDLFRFASAGAVGAPGAGIPIFRPTGTDRQDPALLIDQYLHIINLWEAVQAGGIYIKFVIVERYRRLINMGEELTAYHLVAIVVKVTDHLQNLITTAVCGRSFRFRFF